MVLSSSIPMLQISLLMFTPAGPDPELAATLMDDGRTVHVYINGITAEYNLEFESVWPGLSLVDDAGNIDLQFTRSIATPWSIGRSFILPGIKESKRRNNILDSHFLQGSVKSVTDLNNNVRRMTISYTGKIFTYQGVGRFVEIKMPNSRMDAFKAYPVPILPVKSLVEPNRPMNASAIMGVPFHFIFHKYGHNSNSAWAYNLSNYAAVLISKPQHSTFDPIILESKGLKNLYLIAYGMGLTPLLSVLLHAFHKSKLKVEFYLKDGCKQSNLKKQKMSSKFLLENFVKYNENEANSSQHFVFAGDKTFLRYSLGLVEEVLSYPEENVSFIEV